MGENQPHSLEGVISLLRFHAGEFWDRSKSAEEDFYGGGEEEACMKAAAIFTQVAEILEEMEGQ